MDKKKNNRDQYVAFRVTAFELDWILRLSEDHGRDLSSWLRKRVLTDTGFAEAV